LSQYPSTIYYQLNQLINTNDYWSNLIYPYRENNHLNDVPAHPITLFSSENGFNVGYLGTNFTDPSGFYFYYAPNNIVVSIEGLSSSRTSTNGYGDWTFSAKMEYENASLIATTGHGLPYTFFDVEGGNIQVTSDSTFNIWHNVDEVIGLSMDGVHYGLFAPTGSSWVGSDTLTSSLNDKGYLSVAILPDSTRATLEFFREHAYAQVTNSTVDWDYDEFSSDLTTTFTYETVLRDSTVGNSDQTLTALYRHQWLNTNAPFTNYSYASPRGEMKLMAGNTFTTTSRFSGILPALPDLGEYDRLQLLDYVLDYIDEEIPVLDTYNSGKAMAITSELVHIADQLGALNARDYFLSELKRVLEDWFTVGGDQEFSYNETWNTVIGYPESFGSATQLNDHHFHYGYAIKAASVVAQYDSAWASQENWGGMVNLLIRDANNWNREDEMLPFLRNFDPYAGHGWASGAGDYDFGGVKPGNNQESSSESMNFATGTILWGEITGQDDIRDLGIFLYANENEAIDQYWFDVDDEVFPDDFNYTAIGRVFGDAGDYDTWFGDAPEFIHGINLLPINGGSLYLAKNPDHIIENYNFTVTQRGGDLLYWEDVFWQYLSMSDAEIAFSYFNADPDYEQFDGESRAHTMHWLYNMKEMGLYNTEVSADIATYAVFVDANNDTTYNAFNSGSLERVVTFSDGFSISIPANTMLSHQTKEQAETIPAAPEPTIEANLVMSIFSDSYPNFVESYLDFPSPPADKTTITTIELIDGNNTLKYDSLNYQKIELVSPINIVSRETFHLDYYTTNTTALQLTFLSSDNSESVYNFEIVTDAWQTVEIPLDALSDSLDQEKFNQLFFTGNGTIYLDNIYFSGETVAKFGPQQAATVPLADPEDVISIFSDTYDNLGNTDFNPNWNQETQVSFVEIDGNNTLKYTNLNYQGTQLDGSVDVSQMEWIYFDYWTSNSTALQLSLISPGDPPLETPVTVNIRQNSWQTAQIPLTEYSGVVNLTEIFQLKFEGNGDVYLDNIYFAKPADLTPAPEPIHDSTKVVSLFSNSYNNIVVDFWSAVWDDADVEEVQILGNDALYYSDVSFAGVEFFRTDQVDGTDLTHLHFHMWTSDPIDSSTFFQVKLVDFGANASFGGGDDKEDELRFDITNVPGFESKEWITFDIPISDYARMTTKANLSQLLFVSRGGIDNFYIDNVYFYTGEATNSELNELDIPNEVQLQQNYPNPFNPSTNIEFSLPSSSEVQLLVFNSIGQLVGTLVDSQLSPGRYTIRWDASNAASGIYYYQLRTDNTTTTKQMLLIK
jgi:endoglucanase Acf2